MFKITNGKGFHITFGNGWTVSVQFGPGNYGDNYDMQGIADYEGMEREAGRRGSTQAEVAVWHPGGALIDLDDGHTVLGYQTPAQVLALLIETAARDARCSG